MGDSFATRLRLAGQAARDAWLKGRNTPPPVVQGRDLSTAGILFAPTSPPPDADALVQTGELHPVIARCVHVVSRDAARARLRLLDYADPNEPIEVEPDQPAYVAIEPLLRVNADTPHEYWREHIIADLCLSGNAYSYMTLLNGNPFELWRMVPEKITVVPSKSADKLIERYVWRDDSGETHDYDPQHVLHFRLRGKTPYMGDAIVGALRDPLLLDRYVRNWRHIVFKNGMPCTLVFNRKTDPVLAGQQQKPTEDQMKRVADLMQAQLQRNNGRPLFMDGWEVTAVPLPTEEQVAFIKTMNFIRAEIAMRFGVTPNQLGDYSDAFRANADQQDKSYWHDTVAGMNRIPVMFLNGVYLPRYFPALNVKFDFDYSEIDAMSPGKKETAEVSEILVRSGQITPAEGRQMNGLDAPDATVENSDEMRYVYMNGRKLGEDPLAALSLFDTEEPGTNGDEPRADDDDESEPESERQRALIVPMPISPESMARAKAVDDWFNLPSEVKILEARVQKIIARMVYIAAEEQMEIDGIAGAFNVKDPRLIERAAHQSIRVAEAIVPTTHAHVRLAIAQGLEEGIPVNSSLMRERIQRGFRERREKWQLDRIARTETHQAQESGGYLAMSQNRIPFKQWTTSRDDRVRDTENTSHRAMEGQVVPVESKFRDPVAHVFLMYPGDTDAGNPASVINCRCVSVSVFDDPANVREEAFLVKAWQKKKQTSDVFVAVFRGVVERHLREWEARVLAAFDAEAEASAPVAVESR